MAKENRRNWAEMPEQAWWGEYRYEMSASLAHGLLATASKKEKTDPQKFLCDYINREFGNKGYCVEVFIN